MGIIGKIFDNAVAIALSIISIITFAQVISRYVFNLPIGWATDVIRIAFIYLLFFGATIAVREKSHLNIDFLTSLLPGKPQKATALFSNLFICFFLVFLIKYGYDFTLASTNQSLPYLASVPMSYLYMAIPISGVFMLIYLIQEIFQQAKDLFNKTP